MKINEERLSRWGSILVILAIVLIFIVVLSGSYFHIITGNTEIFVLCLMRVFSFPWYTFRNR
ncbi:MAG: hypothetical protein KGN01_04570 [Patescibacteria group bacterium]|nr:hypothetical protein [Patescibacteria group bacterium]